MDRTLSWSGIYSEHQKAAAKLAAKSIELSEEEVLVVGATQQPISLSPNHPASHGQAADNWRAEQAMSLNELSLHLLKECRRLRPRWTDILFG